MTSTTVSSKCIKRILSDLKNIDSKLLADNNIFYYHDEENILKGYAMIIGPKESLYEDGYYFFEINFTGKYPFEPPVVKFKTYDGITRFHPNLYRDGKVCLSILNTWRGESWSSCQTLSTVLLTLITLFTDKPFLNEPGVTENYKDFKKYHNAIYYQNINHAILHYLTLDNVNENFQVFYPQILENFDLKKIDIQKRCKDKIYLEPTHETISIYNMNIYTNYKNLYKKVQDKIRE